MNTLADQAPSEPPTQLHPVPIVPNRTAGNLVAPLSTLIGREAEIAMTSALLRQDDVRLVTIIGPGGVGKTRLALEVAQAVRNDFWDGVFVVSLAPVRDPATVGAAIAQVFDIRDADVRPLLDRLLAVLRERQVLLVLDNFEHVIAAAPLVVDLLMACPRMTVLVTSREMLQVSGEHAIDLHPLGLPASTPTQSVDVVAQSEAVQLFLTRVHEARSDFALTTANSNTVAQICRSLDGLPLALELAASRMRVLSPTDLLAQLDSRLALLTGGHRDAPERLQTMRDAISWSYDLLLPQEQQLFRRLSMFVGGFTLEGAEAVGTEPGVLDLLITLVDKSLVRPGGAARGETRYSMLEVVREFALAKLAESGEEHATRSAHAAAFRTLGEAAKPHLECGDWMEWADRLEVELSNCHAAMEWADTIGDAETLASLAGTLWSTEIARGYPRDAGRWLDRALEMRDDISTSALIDVLLGEGVFHTFVFPDRARAEQISRELIELGDRLGDGNAVNSAHNFLGRLAFQQSDFVEAEAHFNEMLALALTSPDLASWITFAHFNLATIAFQQGDLDSAATGFVDVLARSREANDSFLTHLTLAHLGQVRLAQGNVRVAAALMAEALGMVWERRVQDGITDQLSDLAVVAVRTGQVAEAAQLFGAVDSLYLRHGHLREMSLAIDWSSAVADAQRIIGDEAFTAAHTAGKSMALEDAIQMAQRVADLVQSEQGSIPSGQPRHGLSARELEVLRLLTEGLSDKEIAESLGITRRTASKHVETIREKFAVNSRTAAVTYATRHGIT